MLTFNAFGWCYVIDVVITLHMDRAHSIAKQIKEYGPNSPHAGPAFWDQMVAQHREMNQLFATLWKSAFQAVLGPHLISLSISIVFLSISTFRLIMIGAQDLAGIYLFMLGMLLFMFFGHLHRCTEITEACMSRSRENSVWYESLEKWGAPWMQPEERTEYRGFLDYMSLKPCGASFLHILVDKDFLVRNLGAANTFIGAVTAFSALFACLVTSVVQSGQFNQLSKT
eukprot:gnl/MRDRNA2_/MRDRNA2_41388_c0_seq1.p1 gnl/MRDRNA2_/MRDRNA2_41388_c0~~gnl/MRDRNA2_/MRDRNA2_41388_c0_seq1.p1  ORF type:complete len:227 (+),score=18.39 gnl/MRDRNA2_/MRDRNA2_41388_c0_seq1:218-898(+)